MNSSFEIGNEKTVLLSRILFLFRGDKNEALNSTHAFNVIADLNETVVDFFFPVSFHSAGESKVIFHWKSLFICCKGEFEIKKN